MSKLAPSSVALLALLAAPALAHAQIDARRDRPQKPQPPPKQPTLTKAPELLEGAAPVYPEAALEAGLTAEVKVRIHIDAAGNVPKVDVLEPVGNGFDEAAVAAAMQYKFSPAEWDGKPGPVAVETAIHFTIEEEEVPEPPPPPPPEDPPEGELEPDPASIGPPSHGGDYRLPVSISGRAVERGTRRKLSGVIVALVELQLDAVTDESGSFAFHGVPPGEYTVLAVGEGYARLQKKLTLQKGEKSVEVRLWMRPKGSNPYETIVEGERETLEVTKRTLQRKQLTSVPGTFGDPIRVIQTLPGLARTPFLTGALLIRGSNPDDSGIFIDGHRVPLVFHFLNGPSILNPEFLDKIDLYPGGYPSRYGRAIGGIVAVETRSSKSDGVHGSADIDILDAGAYLRVPLGENGSLSVAGRRSYLNFILGFFVPEQEPGSQLIVVPVYYDYQVRLDYDFKKEGKASIFVISSSDRLDVVSQEADAENSLSLNSAIRFFRVIGSYKRPLFGDLTLTISPAFGRDAIIFSSGQADADNSFTDVEVGQDTLSYRMSVRGKLSKRLILDTGFDIESRVTHYELLIPFTDNIAGPVSGQIEIPPELTVFNIDGLAMGMYADVGWNVTDDLLVIPGLRWDSYVLSGEFRSRFDPRMVARYKLDKHWLVKGYAGFFHQASQPEGYNSQLGNPNLGLEKAMHYGFGGEWRPTKNWLVDAEVYYVDRTDLAHFSVATEPIDGDPTQVRPVNFENTGISDTYGLELLIKREVTKNLYGWLSYTLSRSMQQRYPDSVYQPTAFDQRHTLNAVASYRLDSGWEFGARFQLATGRPTTPIVGSTFDVDGNFYDQVEGAERSARLPAFHKLDVRAEKTWLFNNWSISAYLDIQNVYNQANVEAIQYDYRWRQTSPVTSVPFLPTLGVKGQW